MKKYFSFYGRAKRQEYWCISLLAIILSLPLLVSEEIMASVSPFLLYDFLPLPLSYFLWFVSCVCGIWLDLAVTARRLRDIKMSCWYMLLILVPIVGVVAGIAWGCIKSKKR